MADKLTARLSSIIATDLEQWLPAAIDAHLENGGAEPHRTDGGWWHPSALSNDCEARMAFDFLGVPQDATLPARTRRVFDNGHGRDRYYKQYLADAGLSLLKGDWVKGGCPACGLGSKGPHPRHPSRHICLPDVRIRGEIDDYIQTPEGPYVFECKTKNDALWRALRQPDPEHIIQCQPYMVAKGTAGALILYENKNDQQVKVFRIPHDRELWERTLERLAMVVERLQRGEMLIRSCRYCDHKTCATFDFDKAWQEKGWK